MCTAARHQTQPTSERLKGKGPVSGPGVGLWVRGCKCQWTHVWPVSSTWIKSWVLALSLLMGLFTEVFLMMDVWSDEWTIWMSLWMDFWVSEISTARHTVVPMPIFAAPLPTTSSASQQSLSLGVWGVGVDGGIRAELSCGWVVPALNCVGGRRSPADIKRCKSAVSPSIMSKGSTTHWPFVPRPISASTGLEPKSD